MNCSRLLILLCALWVIAPMAMAQGDVSGDDAIVYRSGSAQPRTDTIGPYYYLSENELRTRKLARGVANVGLCVAEIPNQMFQEAHKTSSVTGSVVGFFKGIGKGTKRLAIGAWEIATFYHPTGNHYQPYVQPEVVFMEYQH